MKPNPSQFLETTGTIINEIEELGLTPILIGGMALVVLGSQRVTQDFDFVIKQKEEVIPQLVNVFYKHGMELVSKLSDSGQILSTIDNKKIAEIRLKVDRPDSAYFYNPKTSLRIDLLFDFPKPVEDLLKKSQTKTISSKKFTIASKEDLIILKRIAIKNRTKPGDKEDLEFLEKLN